MLGVRFGGAKRFAPGQLPLLDNRELVKQTQYFEFTVHHARSDDLQRAVQLAAAAHQLQPPQLP